MSDRQLLTNEKVCEIRGVRHLYDTETNQCLRCGVSMPTAPEPEQSPSKTLSIPDGELWSLVRSLISQGTYIQMDATAGKYQTSEEVFMRIDEAAREKADEIEAKYLAPEPATELSDDFRKGARAMFDSLLCRAANNYHGNPSVDAACTEENKIVTAWAADALAEVSVDDWNEWASITDLRRENDELKAQVRAAPPPSAVLVNAFRAGAFYGCAEEFNPLDLQRDAEAYGSRHSPTKEGGL